jgi:phage tail P2-like protein
LSQSPSGQAALEEILDQVNEQYFDPDKTPAEFLPWLANWVAISLHPGWDETTRRHFLRQIVPLYQQRGTRAGLQQVLDLYLNANELTQGGTVTLYNNLPNFPPHFFQVLITYQQDLQATNSPQTAVQRLQTMRQLQLAVQAIIEQEKPAHTYYALEFALTNTMQLLSLEQAQQQQKEMLRLGQNTLLGTTVGEVGQLEEEYNE